MKKILLIVCFVLAYASGYCQEEVAPRWSFTANGIVQAFKVPLARPSIYWQNKGFSLAATYNLSPKATFQQNVELGHYFNPYHGSSFLLFTSTSFNPLHSKAVQAGLSLGLGYMNSGFSNGGWEQNDKGEWIETSNRKGNLFIPADLHVRVKVYENEKYFLSPMLSYQLNALFKYSHAETILPQSMPKLGLTLTLK